MLIQNINQSISFTNVRRNGDQRTLSNIDLGDGKHTLSFDKFFKADGQGNRHITIDNTPVPIQDAGKDANGYTFEHNGKIFVIGADNQKGNWIVSELTKNDGSEFYTLSDTAKTIVGQEAFAENSSARGTAVTRATYTGDNPFVIRPNITQISSLKAVEDDVTIADGEDDATIADGEDDTTIADGEDDTTIADGEDDATIADGEDDATIADGEDDTTIADGEDDATIADGEDDTTIADGEDDATIADGEDDTTIADGEAGKTVISNSLIVENNFGREGVGTREIKVLTKFNLATEAARSEDGKKYTTLDITAKTLANFTEKASAGDIEQLCDVARRNGFMDELVRIGGESFISKLTPTQAHAAYIAAIDRANPSQGLQNIFPTEIKESIESRITRNQATSIQQIISARNADLAADQTKIEGSFRMATTTITNHTTFINLTGLDTVTDSNIGIKSVPYKITAQGGLPPSEVIINETPVTVISVVKNGKTSCTIDLNGKTLLLTYKSGKWAISDPEISGTVLGAVTSLTDKDIEVNIQG
ncbi:hypothetical protein NO1_0051 [Candidatus Termititenax aidoneus]|uniref:Uncharacterized protein n=1 Tax=Termititenax aidoneus TaxID=2218524 RepID=A0A388T8N3_TERA1|nr:hypothetical protein NO1_0051 [Candidatus Termititenax aidoneus]